MHRTETTVRMLQAVAATVSLAVIFWSFGFPFMHFAKADALTSVSNTLSDSDVSQVSNHTIEFVTPTGVASGQNIVITFEPASFDLSFIGEEDIDLLEGGVAETMGTNWTVGTTSNTITLTSTGAGGVIDPGATTTILIGLHATNDGTPDTQITNPTAGSYDIDITAGNGADSGSTVVVILDDVVVTAAVDTIFTFSVSGVNAGQTVNGTTTTGTSSATAIDFGLLVQNTPTTTAQDLTVTTNASEGYVVTVFQSQDLMTPTGETIDSFIDGAYTDTPTTWTFPSGQLSDDTTWGHWGLTSEDATTTEDVEFGSGEYVAASSTPRVVMSHDGPADGSSQGIGVARVGYTISITALQEASNDYSTTLTYVATPTF